jgi:hypothetical protein
MRPEIRDLEPILRRLIKEEEALRRMCAPRELGYLREGYPTRLFPGSNAFRLDTRLASELLLIKGGPLASPAEYARFKRDLLATSAARHHRPSSSRIAASVR